MKTLYAFGIIVALLLSLINYWDNRQIDRTGADFEYIRMFAELKSNQDKVNSENLKMISRLLELLDKQ